MSGPAPAAAARRLHLRLRRLDAGEERLGGHPLPALHVHDGRRPHQRDDNGDDPEAGAEQEPPEGAHHEQQPHPGGGHLLGRVQRVLQAHHLHLRPLQRRDGRLAL
eukprot:EG_transcript_31334